LVISSFGKSQLRLGYPTQTGSERYRPKRRNATANHPIQELLLRPSRNQFLIEAIATQHIQLDVLVAQKGEQAVKPIQRHMAFPELRGTKGNVRKRARDPDAGEITVIVAGS
jgi:hypothetical protein